MAGNNATALEVRRELQQFTAHFQKKRDPKSTFCMVLADNPKHADAVLSVESIVNGRAGLQANYTSSAQLTAPDETLLWSDSIGDGSKFADVMVGGSPRISADRLLRSAAKKVCPDLSTVLSHAKETALVPASGSATSLTSAQIPAGVGVQSPIAASVR